jgi:8-hydroxy-5-deazaflavin:NADPH oxidoreductase
MKIGIFGSGSVGKTLATKLVGQGQKVMVGTRSPDKLREWAQAAGARVGTYADTAAFGEILFNATRGESSIEALRMAGEVNLNGKILVDVANPLDFSGGMPPTLTVSNTDSLGEQIQRAFPGLRVVKSLNTLNADLTVNPGLVGDGDHTIFVSGNDGAAKAEVSRLLAEWFGWRDIIDLGDITTARGTEAMLPVWVRLMMVFGHASFQFKIVR